MWYLLKKSKSIALAMIVAIIFTSFDVSALAFAASDNDGTSEVVIEPAADENQMVEKKDGLHFVGDANTPQVKPTLNDKSIAMELKGTSITKSSEDIIKRINEIRKEACEQGIKNPDTGNALTMNDYREIKWSADLEAIARVRAAEASIYMGHTRTNNTDNTTAVTNNNIKANYELIAWNSEADENTLLYGINQWYKEKDSYKNNSNDGKDYKYLISPSVTHVGVSSFKSYLGGMTATTCQLGKNINTSSTKDNTAGQVKQRIEVSNSNVTKISLAEGQKAAVEVGKTTKINLAATAKYKMKVNGADTEKEITGKILSDAKWSSADTKTATVDKDGNIKGVENGYVNITATVAGKSFTFKLTVGDPQKAPVDITKAKIVIKDQEYCGSPIIPKKSDINGTVGYRILVKDVDYVVECKNNVEVGTATITLKAIGKNTGTCTTTFKIVPRQMKNVTLDMNQFRSTVEYTGNPITQIVKLYVDNKGVKYTLKPEEYTVEYENNVNVGKKATVIIRGKGNFTGMVKKKFKITPLDVNSGKLTVSMNSVYTYTKGGCKPDITVSFNGTTLTKGKDFVVSYKNTKGFRGTAVIKGKKNFTGKISKTYEIENQNLAKIKIFANDIVWKDKAGNFKVKPVITDVNGKKLKANTDYSKIYEYHYADVSGNSIGAVGDKDVVSAGTLIKVIVRHKPGSHYDGETSYVYRVVEKSIAKAKVSLDGYVGDEHIKADQLYVTLKGDRLEPGKDFEVLECTLNKKGTKATVTIHGLGVYGGIKKYTYKLY